MFLGDELEICDTFRISSLVILFEQFYSRKAVKKSSLLLNKIIVQVLSLRFITDDKFLQLLTRCLQQQLLHAGHTVEPHDT